MHEVSSTCHQTRAEEKTSFLTGAEKCAKSAENRFSVHTKTDIPWCFRLLSDQKGRRTYQLCDLFGISLSGVRQRYRKEHPAIAMIDGQLKLKQAVKPLAVSSADCERAFSERKNIIVCLLLTQLQINKVSALMFIFWLGLLWTSGIQKKMLKLLK